MNTASVPPLIRRRSTEGPADIQCHLDMAGPLG